MSKIRVLDSQFFEFKGDKFRIERCLEGSKRFVRTYIYKGDFQFQMHFYDFIDLYFFGFNSNLES